LLRSDFLEIFSYAYQKHALSATLVSNGLTLTPVNLKILKNNGLANLQISLDGASHAINSQIRGGSQESFDRILASLAYCLEAGVPVTLGVMPHPLNIDDIPNIVSLAERYGIEYIRFCPFVPFGRGHTEEIKKSYILNHQQFEAFLHQVNKIEKVTVMIDSVCGPTPPDYSFGCRLDDGCPAGTKLMYISANGEVFPCTALWDQTFKVGSIREKPLKQIYLSDEMRKVGNFSKSDIKGLCRACKNFGNCGGACRGTVYSLTGDLSASLPYCYYRTSSGTGQ
jgi:radical SAM protein with 4Fe4S-binding SPASM domain